MHKPPFDGARPQALATPGASPFLKGADEVRLAALELGQGLDAADHLAMDLVPQAAGILDPLAA